MKRVFMTCLFTLGLTVFVANAAEVPAKNERLPSQTKLDGFKNTPMHPDGKFHIHDPDRPQPPVVEPKYDGKPVPPPQGAKIIFAGKETDALVNKKWPIKDGIMTVGKGSQKSKEAFAKKRDYVFSSSRMTLRRVFSSRG